MVGFRRFPLILGVFYAFLCFYNRNEVIGWSNEETLNTRIMNILLTFRLRGPYDLEVNYNSFV